jgi:hypothetical protein
LKKREGGGFYKYYRPSGAISTPDSHDYRVFRIPQDFDRDVLLKTSANA